MNRETLNAQARGTEHFVGVNKMVGGAVQSQRDRKRNFQPQRGCIVPAPMGCNPFRVGGVCFTVSQGSAFLATLGWMMESRWDSRAGARRARDLEQTIAGNVAEILEA